jgi:hypothetical protein
MLECDLAWKTRRQTLCPSCLEALNRDNIVFRDNLAFCPLCALDDNHRAIDACLYIFSSALSPDHWATYRGLLFFTPTSHPIQPLQLVRRDSEDSWLLDPLSDNMLPSQDHNPVAGGSPV